MTRKAQAVATRSSKARKTSTVLLVEDDDGLRAALRFALELDGFEVWTFATAEALLDLGRLPGEALLVLDEKLPGMTGLDLLEELRRRQADMPVILITTSTPAVRARAKALSAPIVEKPLLNDDLLRKVEAVASQIRSASTPREPG